MTRLILISALLLSACARTPGGIEADSVSSSNFDLYSCNEMQVRAVEIETELADAVDNQRGLVMLDTVATLGMLPVFSTALSEDDEAIARLRGERIAIQQARQERGCRG
ncbi:hypothetical protein V8J85_02525 [Yoonia sp. 2307UL14-13]